jgi:hypothetical protein
VVLVPSRLLPVEDRGNRYVYAAIGVFAVAVDLAARACGRTAEVALGAYPGVLALDAPETVVASVTLTGEVAPSDDAARTLLQSRRTSRLPYRPVEVALPIRERLVGIADSFGHRLKIESDPGRVDDFLRQNAWAIIDNLQITGDRREIERWVRYGATPAHGDGLWQIPLVQPRWELALGFRFPWLFRIPGISHLAVRRFAAAQAGTRHVALLSGPFREWTDLFRAGKLLMELWLEMAAHDVYMHPYGSTLTNPDHARIIASKFGDDEGWLIFRFGHSDVPPESPRLETVVLR